jgi:hypothetical protein
LQPPAAARSFFKKAASPHWIVCRRGSGRGVARGAGIPPAWQFQSAFGYFPSEKCGVVFFAPEEQAGGLKNKNFIHMRSLCFFFSLH